jgi:excisionase family DNA binding protein
MVRQLGPLIPAPELARRLNAAGLVTGHGRPFDVKAVQWIRHACNIPAPEPYAAGEVSAAEAASRLGCSTGVIYHWIHTGQLNARRGQGSRLCIPWNSQVHARCRELITQSARMNRAARPRTLPAPPSPAAEGEVSVTEAAYRLGCSIWVIYYWIETGKLAARRSAGSRLHIPWDKQVQAGCRARIGQSGHLNPAARKTKPRQRHSADRKTPSPAQHAAAGGAV